MVVPKRLSGIHVLKISEPLLTMTRILDDHLQAQRPKMLKKFGKAIHEDRRCTVNDICEIGDKLWTCQKILTQEYHMQRIAATFVPRS